VSSQIKLEVVKELYFHMKRTDSAQSTPLGIAQLKGPRNVDMSTKGIEMTNFT